MLNRIHAWLWSWLPDRCEMYGCNRTGIRGNENIVHGHLVCDDCHAALMSLRDPQQQPSN